MDAGSILLVDHVAISLTAPYQTGLQDTVDGLIGAANARGGSGRPREDITIVPAEMPRTRIADARYGVVVTVATPKKLLDIQFPACTEQTQQVRDAVRETLRGQGCGEEYVYTTSLAVDEVVCNIIRHAYCGVGTGEIVLQILRLEKTLVFHLIDFAPPIDAAKVKSRDPANVRPGGIGVYLIRQIMDTLAFEKPPEGPGNLLVMTRKLECR